MLERSPRNKRIWAQDVKVSADVLEARLASLTGDPSAVADRVDREALAAGVRDRLTAARNAALRVDPLPGRVSNWWRGTLIEAAYQNLHAAESLIVDLYNPEDVEAEIPEAVARIEAGLGRDDPRRIAALDLLEGSPADPGRRQRLRKAVEVGFGSSDLEHSRLRSFRNAVVASTIALVVTLVVFVAWVSLNPTEVSFCFTPSGKGPVCPSGSAGPGAHDVLTISLLGVLGGLLSAIVSIRNVRGTSLAYDVPQALAMLKMPLGALCAIGGLLLIRGDFIPGFSALDSQDQILAYAFGFGVAQQLLIGLIDRRAQTLLDAAPGKTTAASRPERTVTRPTRHDSRPGSTAGATAGSTAVVSAVPSAVVNAVPAAVVNAVPAAGSDGGPAGLVPGQPGGSPVPPAASRDRSDEAG
ncbi:MAG TPA: hypothetical protein VFQ11_00135 [Nocardioidaceae bacterium]|nr:hypothetical protein [Nocardioidaceae bacterium]